MFAAAGSAYIMQCSSAGPLRRKQLTMLISGLAMAAVVGLAGALKGHLWLQDILIVSVAALAYYFRRFLPDKNQFPIFGFVLCVLASVLSTGWRQGLQDMLAVATGAPIAFGTYFFILPPNIVRAAHDQIRYFREDAAEFLHARWRRRRFAAMISRPAFLKGLAENQPDHGAAPRIHEAADDEYAMLEAAFVIAASAPGRTGPGIRRLSSPDTTSSFDDWSDLALREAAQRLAVRSAAGRFAALQDRLADTAAALAAATGERAS
jgi:hypothetical protein